MLVSVSEQECSLKWISERSLNASIKIRFPNWANGPFGWLS
jgi:hypothetical protein